MRQFVRSFGIRSVALCCLFGFLWSAVAYAALTPQSYSLETVESTTGMDLGAGCLKQLRQYGCDSGGVYCTPHVGGRAGGMGGLNPEFACRLVPFLKKYGGRIRIISAFRSYQKQLSMCGSKGRTGCAKPGRSCHQYGLAVDVTNLHLRVKQTEMGLIRPYSGPHLQCQENRVAACSPSTKGCSGKYQNPHPGGPVDGGSVPSSQEEMKPGEGDGDSGGAGGGEGDILKDMIDQQQQQPPQEEPEQKQETPDNNSNQFGYRGCQDTAEACSLKKAAAMRTPSSLPVYDKNQMPGSARAASKKPASQLQQTASFVPLMPPGSSLSPQSSTRRPVYDVSSNGFFPTLFNSTI